MWLLQHDRLLIHTICGVRQGPLLLHVLLMWMKPHPSGLVHGDVSMTFGDIDEYYNPADDNFNALKPEKKGCVSLCFCLCWRLIWLVNTFRPEQNICNFANNIFKCILRNGKFEILIDISVKFVLDPIRSSDNDSTFNKEIGFLCGLKFFPLNIFCGEYIQSSLHLMLQIWWKPLLWKVCQ